MDKRAHTEIVRALWAQGLTNGKDISNEAGLRSVETKLASLLAAGDYYCYLFDMRQGDFAWISDGIESVLGYPVATVNSALMIEKIHPDDLSWFIAFENTVMKFFGELPIEKLMKYKVRYDYRFKKSDGSYARILQQVVTFSHDESGKLLTTLGTHTDITYLKCTNQMSLSFIGLDGEPSYLDVNVNYNGLPVEPRFTFRERQIIRMLGDGASSKLIADSLCISVETVNTHRRRLLKKAGVNNVAELIRYGVLKGLL